MSCFDWVGLGIWEVGASVFENNMEINFIVDVLVYDGCYVNNFWFQEFFDLVTKLIWDNVVFVSLSMAKCLGLRICFVSSVAVDMINVMFGDVKVEMVVWVILGVADNVIVVSVGYGCVMVGMVGSGCGFDVGFFRVVVKGWFGVGVNVEKIGKTYEFVLI